MWQQSAWMKENGRDLGMLMVRLAAGVIFMIHGYGKLFGDAPGMEMFTGMVDKLGFPLAGAFAYAAALTEFFGGLALILGVFTCTAASLLAVVMLVAWGMVKKFALPAGDADLALLAISLLLAFAGSGKFTVKGLIGKQK